MDIDTLVNYLSLAIACILAASMLTFALVSLGEGEPRAFRRALLAAILLPLPFVAVGLYGLVNGSALWSFLLVMAALVSLALPLAPMGNDFPVVNDRPSKRFDERDIIFARRALIPGSERFESYYRRRPEKKILDDKWRSRPGLMSEGARYFDPISAASTEASFDTVEAFYAILDQDNVKRPKVDLDPLKISNYIKSWALELGAVSVGITELREYHLYSHIGRGDGYGEPVVLNHDYAVALSVEMTKKMVDSAPYGPEMMETARLYLNSGAIAVQIAEFIRQLGYSARAHIDGSYRVICPLVARDAGLGEIGRMGLLMTPELGPRVRLAVVTTAMPLSVGEVKRDPSMLAFCEMCKKCADVCPSKSIPYGSRQEIGGAYRWQINAESCFTYWCTVGTDCGLCMRSCPYSHPSNPMHNLVRWGIKRSGSFRRFALILDDLFYGRIPVRAPAPEWLNEGIEAVEPKESSP